VRSTASRSNSSIPPTAGIHSQPWRAARRCCVPARLRGRTATSSTIYHAFRGGGVTTIDGKKYEWSEGDCFVVPLWSWHSHQNASKKEEAILFSVNDQPTLEALKLYREEPGEAGK